MPAELKQRRDAIKRHIKQNPTRITIYRKGLVDDGMGGTVEDPFGDPTEHTMTVRLSHEQSSVPKNGSVPAGVSTNLQRFLLTDWQTTIYEDDTFEAIGKSWRVGPVDTLYASSGITGYQAPLVEAEGFNDGGSS